MKCIKFKTIGIELIRREMQKWSDAVELSDFARGQTNK